MSVLLDREKGLVLTRSHPAAEPPLASPDTRLASGNAIWDLLGEKGAMALLGRRAAKRWQQLRRVSKHL